MIKAALILALTFVSFEILRGDGIGPLSIGMHKSQLFELGHKVQKHDEESEGFNHTYYTVDLKGGVIRVDLCFKKICSISTKDPAFKRHSGVGVGDQLNSILKNENRSKMLFLDEEGYHLQIRMADGTIFMFDTEGIPIECFKKQRDCRDMVASRTAIKYVVF